MSNIKCEFCGTTINPVANTHACQPIGSTVSNTPIFSTGAHPLQPAIEYLHCNIGNHCRLPNCPYSHDVCTSDKCPVCLSNERKSNVHFSSKTDEWETPQNLFDEYNNAYHFGVDVCATVKNTKVKYKFYTKQDNALNLEWTIHGNAWMNPPYGREIGRWVKKAYEQGNRIDGYSVVCLLPARTDTKWFHDYVLAGQYKFLKGRLKFGNSKNSAPFPSMIVIFSRDHQEII